MEFDDVSFRYPGREEWALRQVSLTLAPGEKLGLVGENGAGKSTLVKLLLGFGLVFELPVVIFAMVLVGVVDYKKLWRFNRYFVVIAFVAGGILTPGPDVLSQILMSVPLIVLYNISTLLALLVFRRKQRREARAAEEAYMLYQKKHEEARISAAMDQQKIVNVSIAQPAQRPLKPVGRKALNLLLGLLLGAIGGLGFAFVAEYLDHSFTTGRDLEARLGMPLLGAIPEHASLERAS